MENGFLRLLGPIPSDRESFKHRHRIHQGWWRTAVLMSDPGPHPTTRGATVCNTLDHRSVQQGRNFLSAGAACAVRDELAGRQHGAAHGAIEPHRLGGNLLSSQPLCFNFWGPLKYNFVLANALLASLLPDFDTVTGIGFERKPGSRDYTNDNSAFDVLIEYRDQHACSGILGLECKYTDSFSPTPYDKPAYRTIFESARHVFKERYEFYIQKDYNQLFRNQLMACAHELSTGATSRTAVFCSEHDADKLVEFQRSLAEGRFLIITHEQFIATLQQLPLSWEQREWTMMLWARYAGLRLSEAVYNAHRRR